MDIDAFMRDVGKLSVTELAAKYGVSERFVELIARTDAMQHRSAAGGQPNAIDIETIP